jgi:hypothetical protein
LSQLPYPRAIHPFLFLRDPRIQSFEESGPQSQGRNCDWSKPVMVVPCPLAVTGSGMGKCHYPAQWNMRVCLKKLLGHETGTFLFLLLVVVYMEPRQNKPPWEYDVCLSRRLRQFLKVSKVEKRKICVPFQAPVARACNPSHLGGSWSKVSLGREFLRTHLTNS